MTKGGGPPRSVALVRLSALGDTVHALPVVASLRHAWPGARIAWVIQPGPLRLHRGHPEVDEFLVFRRELGARGFPEFRRRVRGRRFDLVLDCHGQFKSGLVTALLGAPVKVGFDRPRARDLSWVPLTHRVPVAGSGHAREDAFRILEFLDVPVREEWDFHFTEEERAARDRFFARVGGPALAVVLRSSRAAKDWTPDGYARVLEVARFDLGLRPLLVGGVSPGEEAWAAAVSARTRAGPVDARADDLRRLAWLLDGSAVALSPDTGPLHIAVALGTPTVGLYGATDPRRHGPWGRHEDLVVDRHAGARRTPRPRCGTAAIAVGEVAEKLELALRRAAGGPDAPREGAAGGGDGPAAGRERSGG